MVRILKLRFTLRFLFVLLAFVAALAAWLGHGLRMASRQQHVMDALGAEIGDVYFADERRDDGSYVHGTLGLARAIAVRLFGEAFARRIHVVEVSGLMTISDSEFLERVGRLDDLRILDIAETDLTGGSLARIRNLTRLEHLHLNYTNATDDDIRAISTLASLHELGVSHTRITDDAIESLVRLRRLRVLNLRNTAISDHGAIRLASLPDLEVASLAKTHVTNTTVERLAGCKRLKHLNLAGTKVDDGGMKHLAAFVELEELRVEYSGVTTDGLKYLPEVSKLRVLVLDRSQYRPEVVQQLEKDRPGLEILSSYWPERERGKLEREPPSAGSLMHSATEGNGRQETRMSQNPFSGNVEDPFRVGD